MKKAINLCAHVELSSTLHLGLFFKELAHDAETNADIWIHI